MARIKNTEAHDDNNSKQFSCNWDCSIFWAATTRHLAKQLKDEGITNVTINACHPGAVATNFGQEPDKGFLINLIFKGALWVTPKPEVGARTSIYLNSFFRK